MAGGISLDLREKSNGTKMPRSCLHAPMGDETKPSGVLRDAAQSCCVGVRCHHSSKSIGLEGVKGACDAAKQNEISTFSLSHLEWGGVTLAKLVRVQLSTLCAVCLAPTLRSADGRAALTLILPERSCCYECAPGGRRFVRGDKWSVSSVSKMDGLLI